MHGCMSAANHHSDANAHLHTSLGVANKDLAFLNVLQHVPSSGPEHHAHVGVLLGGRLKEEHALDLGVAAKATGEGESSASRAGR
jgi:hypothetical protein